LTQTVDISALRATGQYLVERDLSTGLDMLLVRLKRGGCQLAGTADMENDDVIVAYSRRCTHMACYLAPVPKSPPGQIADDGLLHCPCHLSCFDLRNAGLPVIGPATDCLAQMGLRKVDPDHVELTGWIQTKSAPYGLPYGGTTGKPNGE
jgi:Rieske Fe-S protein